MSSRNTKHRNNKTRKEIRAELIGEAQKAVQGQLDRLNDDNARLKEQLAYYKRKYAEKHDECEIWRDRALAAEEVNQQVNDHNRRLMEFMDMSPEQRKSLIEKLQADAEISKKMKGAVDVYVTFERMLLGNGIGLI